MKAERMLGNKIIVQKMHKKERMRHLTKLQQIKTRPSAYNQQHDPSFFRQSTPIADSEKHLEIERNNIALFNRIASIIKERPKIQFPKSRTYVKSLDRALMSQERKQIELKAKYEQYAKRINEQQPTIRNESILKDRIKHERYLKFIGKYPFNPHRRTQTDFDLSLNENDGNFQVFHQKSLDFDIKIQRDSTNNEFIFNVKDLSDKKEYRLGMDAEKFKASLNQCNLSYEQLVGRLRMEKNGEMRYCPTGEFSGSASALK